MAVLDHATHPSTMIGDAFRWGCHNKPRPPAGAGYWAPRRILFPDGRWENKQEWIPFTMSRECRNDYSLTDPHCRDCKWCGTGEQYSKTIRENGS